MGMKIRIIRYDIKVYEENEEMETIRDLKYSQMLAIKRLLDRLGVKYLIKERDEYEGKKMLLDLSAF